jgi:hypothetical protein
LIAYSAGAVVWEVQADYFQEHLEDYKKTICSIKNKVNETNQFKT